MLIAAATGIVVAVTTSKDKSPDLVTALIMIPVIGVILGSSLYRSIKRQQKLLESYTLTLTENMIMREQLNTAPIGIYLKEVKEIIKLKNGNFIVKAVEVRDIICIPAQVDNYTQLETELNQIRPVIAKTKETFIQKFSFLPGLAVLGLMITVYTGENKWLVTICGVLFTGLVIWGFVRVQRSKNVPLKAKRGMWWVLVLLFSVAYVVISKLTGAWSR